MSFVITKLNPFFQIRFSNKSKCVICLLEFGRKDAFFYKAAKEHVLIFKILGSSALLMRMRRYKYRLYKYYLEGLKPFKRLIMNDL
ncbi:MAG: hypothetical protein RLZZ628_1192 [Bacteroidota bacterium]|jgi:hypothetical protein